MSASLPDDPPELVQVVPLYRFGEVWTRRP